MAHRVLMRYPLSIYKETKKVIQHFSHLLVLDFECTCIKDNQIEPQEIIELPCAVVCTKNWEIVNTFHKYIKPRFHPQLTPFCIDLTGIMQDMVDKEPYFPEVFQEFCNWLKKYNYSSENSAFVTCGNWDLQYMLPYQCQLEKIQLPVQYNKWINLKNTFCDATEYYPRSLKDMLSYLKLPMYGKLHSGIDDVRNMVQIIQSLQSLYNIEFKINNVDPNILKKLTKI
ncbi:ERI1 exoribonuclease 3 [Eufriesea mexicana]|uniref:ERI1 exoribonuclease 3 n=1 Tax=Eufriesea mexicana TaxID=516756 RepID=UPI00083C010A|nr:PREDICTED: ERI1 exoribonuclease 3 [Eufriesea mexicana]OAD54786.1 ERI1 exoribonuclease 3 [Eufriesea mexicana]